MSEKKAGSERLRESMIRGNIVVGATMPLLFIVGFFLRDAGEGPLQALMLAYFFLVMGIFIAFERHADRRRERDQ